MSQTYLPWLISALLQCLNRLAKMALRVSVKWRSIDRLYSPMGTVLCVQVFGTWTTLAPQPTLHIRTLYRRTFPSRLAGNEAYLFSALVYRRAIKIDAASARSDCTGTLLLVLCIIGYCKSIAQRIRVFLNVIEIRTNIGNKTNNKQEQVTVFT